MKQAILTTIVSLALIALNGSAQDYELVFCDDFNGTELDQRVWNIEVNGNGGGNAELQYYRAENVTVAEGCLMLTARKEDWQGKPFTSGRINSMGKAAFKHGKVEASICIPQTAGDVAIWTDGVARCMALKGDKDGALKKLEASDDPRAKNLIETIKRYDPNRKTASLFDAADAAASKIAEEKKADAAKPAEAKAAAKPAESKHAEAAKSVEKKPAEKK